MEAGCRRTLVCGAGLPAHDRWHTRRVARTAEGVRAAAVEEDQLERLGCIVAENRREDGGVDLDELSARRFGQHGLSEEARRRNGAGGPHRMGEAGAGGVCERYLAALIGEAKRADAPVKGGVSVANEEEALRPLLLEALALHHRDSSAGPLSEEAVRRSG